MNDNVKLPLDESVKPVGDDVPDITPPEKTPDDKGEGKPKDEQEKEKQIEEPKPKDEEKPKDEKEEVEEIEQVDIDGVVYKIDKEGNAVDENGKVAYNKEELEKFSVDQPKDEEEVDYISELTKRTNIVLADEQGNPINYENTIEGLSKYVSDVRERSLQEATSGALDKFFQAYPELQDVYRHIRLNDGSMEGYTPSPNYSKLKLDENNSEQLENLIITARLSKGDSQDEAKRFLKYSKDDGLVKEDAKNALDFLQKKESEVNKQQEELLLNQEKKEQEQIESYWNDVTSTLQKGRIEIGDQEIVLPKVFNVKRDGKVYHKTVKDFQDYIGKPQKVKIGDETLELTENQLDLMKEKESRNHNHDIYEALRRFLGYDESQLIKGAVNADKVKRIRKLSTASKKGTSTNKQTTGKLKLPI